MPSIHEIIAHFSIDSVEKTETIKSGLMHSTFAVDTASDRYILQRLHSKLATAEIMDDYAAVTAYLSEKGLISPRLIRTIDGHSVYQDDDRSWWRLTTRIPGNTPERVDTTEQAEEGARALGRFHRAVVDFDYAFKSQHPLHDTIGHLERLEAALSEPKLRVHQDRIKDEIAIIIDLIPQLLLPDDLPQRVVHGDPKISNILFEGSKAVGLIDLDTCNRHTVLVDLGDAVRSWCRDGSEDERHRFQIKRFEAMLRGYAAEGPSLTSDEIQYLAQAGRLITLELASRFARDVLEDEYFAYDEQRYPDRRTHNCARTKAMIFLAEDMRQHQEEMQDLVDQYFGRSSFAR